MANVSPRVSSNLTESLEKLLETTGGEMDMFVIQQHLGMDITVNMIKSAVANSNKLHMEGNIVTGPKEPERDTLLLREVPDDVDYETIKNFFNKVLQSEFNKTVNSEVAEFRKEVNNTWFVRFHDAAMTTDMGIALQGAEAPYNGPNGKKARIRCAIKAVHHQERQSQRSRASSGANSGNENGSAMSPYGGPQFLTPNFGETPQMRHSWAPENGAVANSNPTTPSSGPRKRAGSDFWTNSFGRRKRSANSEDNIQVNGKSGNGKGTGKNHPVNDLRKSDALQYSGKFNQYSKDKILNICSKVDAPTAIPTGFERFGAARGDDAEVIFYKRPHYFSTGNA